jgi:signal transduction histidine kinase/CheY-like chemotaxis protein
MILALSLTFLFVTILVIYSIYNLLLRISALKRIEKSLFEKNLYRNIKYSNKLNHLNKLNIYIQNENSIKEMALDFFSSCLPMTDSSTCFLYLSQVQNKDPDFLSFFKSTGDITHRIHKEEFLMQALKKTLNENVLTRKMALTSPIFSSFFSGQDQFSDWIIMTLGPPKKEWHGILFLARSDDEIYTDIDIEILESLVSQFTMHIENFRLTAKYEESQKIKSVFLSNMSHEIRTPLNAIIGYSEILGQTESITDKKNLIRSIQKNSAQLNSMLDNILDISKIEFGHIHTRNETCHIVDLIQKIIDFAQIRATEKRLEFIVDTADHLPPLILIDQARVLQILMNLIGNAIKFTESGFIILKIDFKMNPDQSIILYFSIIDHGVGISSESQLDLFQYFSQSDTSNTRKYGGLGLGLALSKRLALELGGNVTLVQSQINKGSTFLLEVPSEIVYDERLNYKTEVKDSMSYLESHLHFIFNKKVLIVEDAIDNQEIFKYFLSSAGAHVDIADNGQMAIEMVKINNYDFILMDIQMPIIDGLKATQLIQKNGYKNPIIALTANTSDNDKIKCLDSGCTDIITKPVTQTTLTNQIQTILKDYYERISNTSIS